MKIESNRLDVDVSASERPIVFPLGIPGFEQVREFQLFHQDEKDIVGYLQAIGEEGLTFSVLSPESLNIFYEFTLTDEEQALLQLDQVEDLVLLVIAYRNSLGSVQEGEGELGVNANFMAPLLINAQARIGFQKVLGKAERKITIKAD
ncbi:MAG: flagellar assembly protein FliW [Sedimenticola sp.]|nr:flagellar assembly protein FliW [Sedimenticola sp.]